MQTRADGVDVLRELEGTRAWVPAVLDRLGRSSQGSGTYT